MSGMEYGTPGLPASAGALWEGPRLQYPSGVWWSPFGQANSNMTPVVGDYYSFPFYLFEDCTLNGIGIQIGTGAPTNDAVLKLGLHSHDERLWLPSKLIYASPEITGAPLPASTPQAVNGLSISLRRGIYWAGYMFTAATTLTNSIHVATFATAAGNQTQFPFIKTYGSGATPSLNIGNDGTIAKQTVADIPSLFAGTWLTDSNAPKKAACMFFLTSSGRLR